MKSVLILDRTEAKAGAEKMADELARGLTHEGYRVERRTIAAVGLWRAIRGSHDLVHTHLFLPALLMRVRRIFDAQTLWIHTVHYDQYEHQRFGTLKKFLDRRWIFPATDRLIAVSHSVMDTLANERTLAAKTSLIYNSVRFTKVARTRTTASQTLKLGALSMLRAERNLGPLIEAVAKLRAQGLDLSLEIAGEGPERARLETQIAGLRLQDHVRLVGFKTNVAEFLSEIDIYVNPALHESFGLATMEAMFASVPIIASDAGELPRLLQNGRFGRLVPLGANFVSALVEAISCVGQDLERAQAAASAGAAHYERLFHPDTFIKEHIALYRRVGAPGVCMISPLVTQATGGIQKQLRLQSTELARRGYRVFVMQKRDPARKPFDPAWSHVEFIETPATMATAGSSRWQRFALRTNGLAFICGGLAQLIAHRRRIRVCHAHQLFSPTILGVLFKRLFNVPLVVKVTASGKFGEKNELAKLPLRRTRLRLFRHIDRLIVLNEEMAQEMKELGFEDERVALVPNGVASAPARSPKAKAGPVRFLYMGRLSSEKSLETLIRAAFQMADATQPIQVTLIGGASFGGRDVVSELRALASLAPAGVSIEIRPPVVNVTEIYMAHDVFVLPSISEGLSNALLEALAHGLPCIVSEIPANTFVVRNEIDALTFPVGDAHRLSEQMKRLAHAEGAASLRARLGEAGRATTERRFGLREVGDRLDRLYREISPLTGPTP